MMCRRIVLLTLASLTLVAPTVSVAAGGPQAAHRVRAVRGRVEPVVPPPRIALKSFDDCRQLRSYLSDVMLETLIQHRYWMPVRPWLGPEVDAPAGAGPSDYTTTNTQEAGVDELDLVKTDGDHLFVAADGRFAVVDSWPPDDSHLLSMLMLDGDPRGLFLHGDLALVVSDFWDSGAPMPDIWGGTRIELVDVADPARPEVRRTIDVEGQLLGARMIDGHVYLVLQCSVEIPQEAWALLWDEELGLPEVDWEASEEERRGAANRAREILRPLVEATVERLPLTELLPLMRDLSPADPHAAAVPLVRCGDVYRPAETSAYSMLGVLHLDLGRPSAGVGRLTATGLLADGWTVYASSRSLYVAQSSRWWWWGWGDLDMTTAVHKFELTGETGEPVRYVASGEVTGWLLNQFSMGESEGHLRVATTEFDWWLGTTVDDREIGSSVSVLADDGRGRLLVTGRLDGIAPGERIYACRFLGDIGYLVTFVQIDPLFTLDLSDPLRPEIVGKLKVPGYSAYLHPMKDDHLLAVGMHGRDDGTLEGLAVSVFDVSDLADPFLAHRWVIDNQEGQWSWSEALHDHHAFTFHRGVLSIPAAVSGGESSFSGLLVLEADEERGIFERGRVDHADLPPDCHGSLPWIRRSVYIEDALYSISNRGIKVNLLAAPDVPLATVPFHSAAEP